jgi:Zn-dependent metalloprotease
MRPHAVDRRQTVALNARVALAVALGLLALAPGSNAASADARPRPQAWGAVRVASLDRAALGAGERAVLRELPSTARVALHPATGRVRFVGGTRARPLAGSLDGLLGRAAGLFGVRNPRTELRLLDRSPTADRGTVVRLQQVRAGLPVLGGELVARLGPGGSVLSLSGELLPSAERIALPVRRLGRSAAERLGAQWVAREAGTDADASEVGSEGLAILDTRILGGPALPMASGPRLVWRVDARAEGSPEAMPVHELVLVDAATGTIAATIPRAHSAIDRRICDFRNRPRSNFRCLAPYSRREGSAPTGRGQVDAVYRLMGDTYQFFRDRFGRDGINRRGAPMVATVRYCRPGSCPLQNAFWEWGPQQTAFGDGWASADDLVGHEFTHGVLDHEARLFYYFQSGAINESFADIFGELIDLTNGSGDDRWAVRWLIGEDLRVGVIRDMQAPGRFGDPDRVRSSRWWTSQGDNGGVHTNSGVGNKAASLIADGGWFNGRRIVGLGITRMAWIEYEAMTNLLTSAADYLDLHDALIQACLNLVGSQGISYASCRSVRDAVGATQMNLLPAAGAPRQAPLCARGRYPDTVFADDLEEPGAGLWDSDGLSVNRNPWYYPPNPNNRWDWDGTWASSGRLNFYAADLSRITDATMTLVRPVALPARTFLRFEHGFRFDAGRRRYDGGWVELSVDGGPWRKVGGHFTHAGYNGRLARGRGNPQGGVKAFTSDSRGWGASRLNLSDFAGHEVRIRFRIASDRDIGSYGWYIDDVRFFRCLPDAARPSGSVTIAGGAERVASARVRVRIAASDEGAGVSRMRISNRGTLRNGLLRYAIEMPYQPELRWLLTDRAWGGAAGGGQKQVFVQLRDRAGNWSQVVSDSVELDP